MRGVFDDEQLEPAQPRHDTELTLGSGTLLLIFFGLVLLCGLCFGMGYAVGHRSAPLIASAAQPALPPSGSFSKPSATAPPVAPAQGREHYGHRRLCNILLCPFKEGPTPS